MTDHLNAIAQPLREEVVHDINADMLIGKQRPGRAQKEDDAEQHPLQLKPGIG